MGGAAVARAHMEAVKRRLKEEKNAKDEDVLVSLQLVNEMLSRGYAFLPIELGKSRGNKYIVEDGKVRLPPPRWSVPPSTGRSISPWRNSSRPPA